MRAWFVAACMTALVFLAGDLTTWTPSAVEAAPNAAKRQKKQLRRGLARYHSLVNRFKSTRRRALKAEKAASRLKTRLSRLKKGSVQFLAVARRLRRKRSAVRRLSGQTCRLQNKTKAVADRLQKGAKPYCSSKVNAAGPLCRSLSSKYLQDWWRACRDGQYDRRDLSV